MLYITQNKIFHFLSHKIPITLLATYYSFFPINLQTENPSWLKVLYKQVLWFTTQKVFLDPVHGFDYLDRQVTWRRAHKCPLRAI